MYSHQPESTPNNKSLIFSVKQKSKYSETKKDSRPTEWTGVFIYKRRLPTLPLLRSTIGVARLNFSVRDGKRWIPRAITTLISYQGIIHGEQDSNLESRGKQSAESLGLLVPLGWDIATLTPAAYPRRRLRRPSGISNLGAGFALRCFQRLSNPHLGTRRCSWRNNRYARGMSNTVLSY